MFRMSVIKFINTYTCGFAKIKVYKDCELVFEGDSHELRCSRNMEILNYYIQNINACSDYIVLECTE